MAYLRFACVYKAFDSLAEFENVEPPPNEGIAAMPTNPNRPSRSNAALVIAAVISAVASLLDVISRILG